MTAEDKRARRAARRQMADRIRPLIRGRMGLYATNAQLKAAEREFVDGCFAQLKRMQRKAAVKPMSDTEHLPLPHRIETVDGVEVGVYE